MKNKFAKRKENVCYTAELSTICALSSLLCHHDKRDSFKYCKRYAFMCAYQHPARRDGFKSLSLIVSVSTPGYLNRFRSGFTLIFMKCTVKNDFDADPFNLNRMAVRAIVSIWV